MESQEFSKNQEPIILTSADEPFKTKQAAVLTMSNKKLVDCEVVSLEGGGFGIKKKPVPKPPKEKFYRVKFNAKSSPNDTDDVILSVNGATLIAQREREIVISERYKEDADHATYPQTRQIPGKNRKTISWIKTYPYEVIGEATQEEFLDVKKKGTKQTKRNIQKYGYDVSPEDLI